MRSPARHSAEHPDTQPRVLLAAPAVEVEQLGEALLSMGLGVNVARSQEDLLQLLAAVEAGSMAEPDALVLEARRIYVFGGQAMGLVVLNLALTFLIPGISIGGHVGGLIGGALCALAFSSLRRIPALATASVVAVGLLSVAVALAQV